MTAHALLQDLHRRGFRLTADGGEIVVLGQRKGLRLTPEAVEAIRAVKPELLQVLTSAGLTSPDGPRASERRAPAASPMADSMQDAAARELLDRLLDDGYTFRTLNHGRRDHLIWFGPVAAPDTIERITALKHEIITLVRAGHPGSRRTWGEPTEMDWRAARPYAARDLPQRKTE